MSYWDSRVDLSTLVGKTLAEVRRSTDEIVFVTDTGETFKMYHEQDCCESVYIEDVEGDLEGLVGNPILIAEEVSNADLPKASEYDESFTWTFYKLATIKGHVDIRWYGTSNGYYSESVDFVKVSA